MLQHVSIEVHPGDVEECTRFYSLLGFERVEPPPSLSGRSVWFERSRTQVHLLLSDAPVAPREAHHAVVVDDYDGTGARLRAAGFDVEPRREHWGAPRAFVRAPGGHRVELMAGPPPMR